MDTVGAYPTRAQVEPEKDAGDLLAEVRRPLTARLDTEGVIGAGGMGTVELVIDRALRRRIAKKVIHPEIGEKEQALFLFVREARITGQLDHPHIVPVHHLGEDRGALFFTMKHVQGSPLSQLLRKLPSGSLKRSDLVDVLTVLLKVCDALSFAHSRGVLHCDLKPANIMVGDFGEVYLMDWGIAKVIDSSVPDVPALEGVLETSVGLTSGVVMGTPNYMSPEQASGDRDALDERSDVFALGAILYRALAGRPPYVSDSPTEVVEKAKACELVPPSAVRDGAVPIELQRITMRAMRPNREERYRSVRHLRDDLQRYLYLAGDFPTAQFEPGEHVIREGEQGRAVYIIERGQCTAYRTERGERIELAVLKQGDVFGEAAILADVPRTASVVADVHTALYVITREVLDNELSDIKPWLARLVRALAERFRDERQRREPPE